MSRTLDIGQFYPCGTCPEFSDLQIPLLSDFLEALYAISLDTLDTTIITPYKVCSELILDRLLTFSTREDESPETRRPQPEV